MVSVSLESVDIGPVASRLNVSPLDIVFVPALSPFTLKLYISGRVTVFVLTSVICPSAEDVIPSTTVNVPPWEGEVTLVVLVLDTLL